MDGGGRNRNSSSHPQFQYSTPVTQYSSSSSNTNSPSSSNTVKKNSNSLNTQKREGGGLSFGMEGNSNRVVTEEERMKMENEIYLLSVKNKTKSEQISKLLRSEGLNPQLSKELITAWNKIERLEKRESNSREEGQQNNKTDLEIWRDKFTLLQSENSKLKTQLKQMETSNANEPTDFASLAEDKDFLDYNEDEGVEVI